MNINHRILSFDRKFSLNKIQELFSMGNNQEEIILRYYEKGNQTYVSFSKTKGNFSFEN
jgi:hypothetical protein